MSLETRLYKIINVFTKRLLRSRFHGALSKHAIVIEYKGHKSGRNLATPAGYFIHDDHFYCFIDGGPWWKNFVKGQNVKVWLRGQHIDAFAKTVQDDLAESMRILGLFLEADPKNIGYFKMKTDNKGNLKEGELEKAAKKKVMVKFTTDTELPEPFVRDR